MTTLGYFRIEARCLIPVTVIERIRSTGADTVNDLRHTTRLRLVSVTEEFARAILVANAEAVATPAHQMVRALWRRAERDVETTWDKQEGAWKDWFSLRLADCTDYAQVKAFVEARNSI